MDALEKSKKSLRKYIKKNKAKVSKDLAEMREKSKKSNGITVDEFLALSGIKIKK